MQNLPFYCTQENCNYTRVSGSYEGVNENHNSSARLHFSERLTFLYFSLALQSHLKHGAYALARIIYVLVISRQS